MFKVTKLLVLISLMSFYNGLRAHEVITISSVDEYTKHMQAGKPIITMFTASWCGPCKQTKPHFFALAKEYADITFCLVDIDNKELSSLTSGVSGVPTFVGVCKNKEYFRTSGGRPHAGLKDLIENFSAEVTGKKNALGKKVSEPAPEPTLEEYYKMGQVHYEKIVAVCRKKDFDAAAFDATILDQAIMPLSQKLAGGAAPDESRKAFECFKAYMRGAKKSLERYKFQQRNPQDAIMRYNINYTDMLLATPDMATYMQKQMKLGEALKLRTWEILADIDFTNI